MTNNAVLTLRASLNEEIFSYLDLILPDFATQKASGDFLHLLNTKIQLNNRINAELEAMAKTLYDYWFVQFDFPDADGKPYKTNGGTMVWNEELKREIPEGWEVGNLSDIANITMGQSPPGESYNDEGKGLIFFQGCTDFGIRFPTVRLFTTDPTRFAKIGDILLSVRAPVGTINIANENCCIGRGLAAINSKQDANTFLFGVMRNLKQTFERRNADGTTFGSITKDDLYSLKVVIPDEQILTSYQNCINPSFQRQNVLELENQRLSNLRDWLLPMLMNGQITVSSIDQIEEQRLDVQKKEDLFVADNKKPFAKQVLGGKIVSLFQNDPYFTSIKFQKIQYLAEHVAEVDLNWNYYYQAAGPYDNVYMHTISDRLKTSNWFAKEEHKFTPLEKQGQIDGYYQSFFQPVVNRLDNLFSQLADVTDIEAEIIATLYAVWNNRIILNQPVTEELLIEDFYNWSDRKLLYTVDQLQKGLLWLHTNNIIPNGFGKEMKKAKVKGKQVGIKN